MQYNIKLVSQWAHDRGLTDQTNDALRSQFIKGVEEGGEISESILACNKDELVDAIGDTLVVLTILCINAGLEPSEYVRRITMPDFYTHGSFESAVKDPTAWRITCEFNVHIGRLARAIAKQQPVGNHISEVVRVINRLSKLLCVDIGECYRTAYNEIKNRTGRKVDGVFVKDE